MTPQTLTTIAEIITSTEQILSTIAQILPYTALAPATRQIPQAINWLIKTIKTLHNLLTTPRGRHRTHSTKANAG